MLLGHLREILNFGDMQHAGILQRDELWCAIFQAVDRLWSPPLPQKVLEIGCGAVKFLLWLDRLGHSVQGINPSESLIPVIYDKLPEKISVWKADPDRLPFESRSFDTVFFVLSLEYMSCPEKALGEAFRVARSSVIIVSFNTYSPYLWLVRLSDRMNRNTVSKWRIIPQGMLVNMSRSVAGLPLRVTSEPVRWRNLGTALLSPVLVTRFDLARKIMSGLEIPLTRPSSRQFVPSPSSYEQCNFLEQ